MKLSNIRKELRVNGGLGLETGVRILSNSGPAKSRRQHFKLLCTTRFATSRPHEIQGRIPKRVKVTTKF